MKQGTRRDRRENGTRTKLEGFDQHMPKRIQWSEFLQNQGNKEELIKVIAQYMTSEEARGTVKQPFIVTEGNNTYKSREMDVS